MRNLDRCNVIITDITDITIKLLTLFFIVIKISDFTHDHIYVEITNKCHCNN